MTDSNVGKTKSRVFRTSYEAGKKLPDVAKFVCGLDHYLAITKVVLPGYKRATTLVEIQPHELERFLVEIREEERVVRKQLVKEKTRQKTQKIKDQKVLIESQEATITKLNDKFNELKGTASLAVKRTKKVEMELSKSATLLAEVEAEAASAVRKMAKLAQDLDTALARNENKANRIEELESILEKLYAQIKK